jgi:hypothetical protein
VKRKINIICSIVIGIIALFGVGILTPIQFVHATEFTCTSNCQGFVQGCKDGKADLDSKASAQYHYDPNTVIKNGLMDIKVVTLMHIMAPILIAKRWSPCCQSSLKK